MSNMEPSIESKHLLEQDLNDDLEEQPSRFIRSPSSSAWQKWTIANLVIFLGTVFIWVSFLSSSEMRERQSDRKNDLLRKTSMYSPIFDHLEIPFFPKRMNASVVDTEPPSIYRQPPSPEVDAAWARLADIAPIVLSSAEVLALGGNVKQTVKYPAEFGFGNDAYAGRIDVFHQIHCLNALRKEIYYEHYFGHLGHGPSKLHQIHTNHCLHVLLENLMCNGNVDVYLERWVDVQSSPFPNFEIEHQCRDFDAILAWHEQHAVNETEFYRLTEKPDDPAAVFEMSQKYKDTVGWSGAHESSQHHD